MSTLKYPLFDDWHAAINKHHNGRTSDVRHWMYEARKMAEEVPHLARLFEAERTGKPSSVHKRCSRSPTEQKPEHYLTCCLDVRCSECPELRALDTIERATPEQIDLVKAWTCAAHIVSKGGDMGKGYVLTCSDRLYWSRVYENLCAGAGDEPT